MYKEIAVIWVEALRSGNYAQGKFALKRCTSPPNFCCLGVLCDLYQKQNLNNPLIESQSHICQPLDSNSCEHVNVVAFNEMCEYLPNEVQNWAGLSSKDGALFDVNDTEVTLTKKNDQGCSFAELANLIERNQEQL
jgi:hypothetical protein